MYFIQNPENEAFRPFVSISRYRHAGVFLGFFKKITTPILTQWDSLYYVRAVQKLLVYWLVNVSL